jgi:ubiquinone/menaquinone biosynthesis C-methylase UbiE
MPRRWYEDYERGRPGYPSEAVRVAGLPSSATVLDLGAGTGKLTRLLGSAFVRVIAVEPDDEMRRLLVAHSPEAEVLAGSAEQIPVADASVDAVFAAECFHWFDTEHALAEVSRVLRPRGALVLMWNVPSGPTEPPIAPVERLLNQHWPKGLDLPLDLNYLKLGRYGNEKWRLAFTQSAFEELRQARLPNPQTVDAEGLVAFFGSMGWISGLPDEGRLLLDDVRSVLTATEYRLPWETHVHWTRLATPPKPC